MSGAENHQKKIAFIKPISLKSEFKGQIASKFELSLLNA